MSPSHADIEVEFLTGVSVRQHRMPPKSPNGRLIPTVCFRRW